MFLLFALRQFSCYFVRFCSLVLCFAYSLFAFSVVFRTWDLFLHDVCVGVCCFLLCIKKTANLLQLCRTRRRRQRRRRQLLAQRRRRQDETRRWRWPRRRGGRGRRARATSEKLFLYKNNKLQFPITHTHARSHYYTMRTARIYFHAYTYTICKHLLLFLTGRGRSANFCCAVVVVAALLQFYDTTTTCIQYAHTHMHARDNMCVRMWILFYILHNLHYRYGRTHTNICIHICIFSGFSYCCWCCFHSWCCYCCPCCCSWSCIARFAVCFLCVISLSTPRCVCFCC